MKMFQRENGDSLDEQIDRATIRNAAPNTILVTEKTDENGKKKRVVVPLWFARQRRDRN